MMEEYKTTEDREDRVGRCVTVVNVAIPQEKYLPYGAGPGISLCYL